MKLAPLGAFGAMAYAIGKYGVSTLTSLGVADRAVLRDVCALRLRGPRFGDGLPAAEHLAHAEVPARGAAADPWHLDRRTSTARVDAQDGVRRRSKPTVGLVVPTGYSFNLDGAAIYLSLAALYIAQATNTNLTIGQQLGLLAVMLLTSKGAAGVAGGGFIALTATLSTIGHIPVVGIMLIFGIDKFMSECRALVNFIGNAVATLFVAKWNGELDVVRARAVFAGKDVEPLLDPSDDLASTRTTPVTTNWSEPTTARLAMAGAPRRRQPEQRDVNGSHDRRTVQADVAATDSTAIA